VQTVILSARHQQPDATPVALKAIALKLGKRGVGFFYATTTSSHLVPASQSISVPEFATL
jgi:hypothetical protein